MRVRGRLTALAAVGSLVAACSQGGGPSLSPDETPEILTIEVATPALDGSIVRITGRNLDNAGATARLRVTVEGDRLVALLPTPTDQDGEKLFLVDETAVNVLGVGAHTGSAAIVGNGGASADVAFDFELASELGVSLDAAPSGNVHRNDVVVLPGGGFLAAGEGTVTAHYVGTFVPDGGGPSRAVDARLPVRVAERFARDRGLVRLTTAIGGGPEPGTFTGRVSLDSSLVSGGASTSGEVAVTLTFQAPDLYGLEPRMFSLGQYVTVRGAGFLGGTDMADETTIIRLDGTFTTRAGMTLPVDAAELVPEWVDGEQVRFLVETAVVGGELVSRSFGAARGSFEGTATPITIAGRTEVAGVAVPIAFTLGPVRQIVYLQFLPGYYDSLSLFGLSSAVQQIEDGIKQRIEDIYAGYNIEVRLDEPTDFGPAAYATLEIGGPDPNGTGLFGYDNSPGKDVGNLRLFDKIGGANAETQADMYPGYGGVFVDSYVYWSTHPDVSGSRPVGAPEPDPLFDEIFDSVRATPAAYAEVMGEGDEARVAAVARAVRAFSSIVGETAAHELGHSLGMAQPYGRRDAYHNDFDGDGCLMDSGGARTIAERAQEPGAPRTLLCYDEPRYLESILGSGP